MSGTKAETYYVATTTPFHALSLLAKAYDNSIKDPKELSDMRSKRGQKKWMTSGLSIFKITIDKEN